MKPPKFKVGQRVWEYDNSRRSYLPENPQQPSYRHRFVPWRVVAQNDRSYTFTTRENEYRINRTKTLTRAKAETHFRTDDEVNERIWTDYRNRISNALWKCDIPTLKAVARTLGLDLDPDVLGPLPADKSTRNEQGG